MTNDNRTSLTVRDRAHNRKQIGKLGLITEFVIFMALVTGMYLILSLTACQHSDEQAANKIQHNKENNNDS